nr:MULTISPECIES: helix-turn-helix domain-containing protein [Enterococcus]
MKSLTEEEVHLFKKTLACFSKNNGSIKNCSEELFIHKNTLQYRLNKFHSLTGYTPRNYDDYHILKLAFLGSIIYGTDESELILQPHFYFRY